MSKHHHREIVAAGGYGYGGLAGYGGYGGCGAGGFNKWIYALLILIVIVLQFGRRDKGAACTNAAATCEEGAVVSNSGCEDNQVIDNSVLFIIVVFLLVICAGCWGGTTSGAGFGGGFSY